MGTLTLFEYGFCVAAGAVALWQLYGILFVQKKIRIKGMVAGTRGSRTGFVLVAAVGLLSPEDVLQMPLVYCCALAVFGVHCLVCGGTGREGLYYGPKCIPYGKISSYQDLGENRKKGFSVDFRCTDGRQYVILFKEEQRDALFEALQALRIENFEKDPDFFDFKSPEERETDRAEAEKEQKK